MPRGRRAGDQSPAFAIEDEMVDTATAEPDLRSLILDLTSKVDAQNTEIASLKSQQRETSRALPKFQPAGGRAEYDAIFSGMVKGKPFARDGDHARYVVGTDSFPISDGELMRNPPRFDVGDYVELNLEATRTGSTRTWGELYEEMAEKQRRKKARLPSKVGYVRFIQYRRDNGEYKYKCIFPGLTGMNPDRDRGDGFDESELLPVSA